MQRLSAVEQSNATMEYTYDAFVSYKRYGEWTPWVRDVFKPLLEQHLSMAIGRSGGARIYLDDRIEAGTDWPSDLRNGVATSRVFIPLFSKMYFGSSWCLRELFAARYKEAELGFRTSSPHRGIIVPLRIHDGLRPDLPTRLHHCCDYEAPNFAAYALTSLSKASPLYLEFEQAVKSFVEVSVMPAFLRSKTQSISKELVNVITDGSYDCPSPADFDEPDLPSLA